MSYRREPVAARLEDQRLAGMGLSSVTGTLVSLGDALADALCSRGASRRWDWTPYLLHWLALLSGAAGGTLAYAAWARRALLFPVAITLILAAVTASRVPRRRAG